MTNLDGIRQDPEGEARILSDSKIRPTTLNKGKESSHNQMSLVLKPSPLNTSAIYEELQKF